MKVKSITKGKNRLVIYGGAFIFIALLATALYVNFPNVSSVNADDPYNSGSDKTELEPISNIWDPTGPTIAPTAAPTQNTWNPTGPTTPPAPTATPQPREAIKIWQTLYWADQNNNGHWVNAPKPFSLASILGSTGDDFKIVQLLQNNIYLNIPSSSISPYTVTAWSFHCRETIKLQDQNGNYKATLAESMAVDKSGSYPQQDSNVWVTGASLNPIQFQSLISSRTGYGSYNFVIELTDIYLTITLSNGDVHTLQPASSNADNVLTWPIKYLP